jgi:hypothetical protein
MSLKGCKDVRVVNEETFKQGRYGLYGTVDDLV